MLIEATHPEETRVAVVKDDLLIDFDFENSSRKTLKGNVYLAKIVRIEPSLQAAFVDYGAARHGFLPFSEIHPDYFRIPMEDRKDETEKSQGSDEEAADSSGEIVEEDSSSEEGTITEDATSETEASAPSLNKKYKIQEVVQTRQVVLVQVIKEERGNKGAALSTFISLPGRYCVLMPNASNPGGVSRKITDFGDRKRLKQLIQSLEMPQGMSLIVRTAGLDRSTTEIKRDYKYLLTLWSEIREETLKATAPSLVYEEGDLIKRSIRDFYTPDVDEILIEGDEQYKVAKTLMKSMVPSHAKKVQPYKETTLPLFYKYKIEEQIDSVFHNRVNLKSGGYIIIDITEALVSIDVNSGRSTAERHIDNTALKTNLEAAEEVARQLSLRDLAGLIVIDFIDMIDSKNNNAVEKKLRDCLREDRARIQVGRISNFGLLEMSRQRLRPNVLEATAVPCAHCSGTGYIRSTNSLALQILRALEEEGIKQLNNLINVHVSSDVGFYLINEKKKDLVRLEEKYGLIIRLHQDKDSALGTYRLTNHEGILLKSTAQIPEVDKKKSDSKTADQFKKQKKKHHQGDSSNKQSEHKKAKSKSESIVQAEVEENKKVESNTSESIPQENKNKDHRKRDRRRRFSQGPKKVAISEPHHSLDQKKATNEAGGKSKSSHVPKETSKEFSNPKTPEKAEVKKVGVVHKEKFLDPDQLRTHENWLKDQKKHASSSQKKKKGWWQKLLEN